MNTNIPFYTLDPVGDPFNLINIINDPDSSWIPLIEELPPLIMSEYIYPDCPWTPAIDQSCEDRRRQLWVLGYI